MRKTGLLCVAVVVCAAALLLYWAVVPAAPTGAGPKEVRRSKTVHLQKTADIRFYYRPGEVPLRGMVVLFDHGCSRFLFENTHLRQCARKLRLGLFHFDPGDHPYPEKILIKQLEQLAKTSQRPELRYAPLLLFGHSRTFPFVVRCASHYPDRVIGMIGYRTGKLNCRNLNVASLRYVPWLLLAGEKDNRPVRITDALRTLALSRLESLPVTFALERDGKHNGPHVARKSAPLMAVWIESVVSLRLSPDASAAQGFPKLQDIELSQGLFTDIQTMDELGFDEFLARGRFVSWLPSERFRDVWRRESAATPQALLPTEGESTIISTTPVADQTSAVVTAEDWPCWRNWRGDNCALHQDVPLTWSEDEHILWRAETTGRGHASVLVIGEEVFLLTAKRSGKSIVLVCLDARDGQSNWECELHSGEAMACHVKNSHASATPAGDGERIYCAHIGDDALWVTAVTRAGEIAWKTRVGGFVTIHGFGSSPVLYDGCVIVAGDQVGQGYIAALDRNTGRLIWKRPRQRGHSFGAPVIARLAGRDQLLLAGQHKIISYVPQSGAILWQCEGMSKVVANTVAFDDSHVYASGGHPEKVLLAVRADGTGSVTDSHVVWKDNRGTSYVASPLVASGRLYLVNDRGVASCRKTKDGELLWRHRLGGRFSTSPVLVANRIYATNEQGETFVFSASDQFELLAKNQLPGEQMASLTMARGRIYARTANYLYCIGDGQTSPKLQATR